MRCPRLSPAFAGLLALLAATHAVSQPYPSTGAPPLLAPSGPLTYDQLLPPNPTAATPPPAAAPVAVSAEAVTPVAAAEPVAAPTPEPVVATTEAADAPLAGAAAEPEPVLHWYQPAYWFGPTPWDSGFELGLNGAAGTSDSLSFRTGGFIKREGKDYKLDTSLYYNKTETEGVEVQSNALLDARYDWLFGDSPWTLFVMSQTFYDEFAAFDINFNANSGFGYRWLNNDRTKLTTSIGTGASREFGGTPDEWVAEASFGVNYELKVAENKKFYAKVDFFPEWRNFGNYRVLTDTGLEIELHQPSNVSLKLAATDRYDSTPGDAERRNLNYSALLIWKL